MHPDALTITPRARSRAPFDTDYWNRYYADWVNGDRAMEALWNDKDGDQQIHMDPDAKTVGIAGVMTVSSTLVTVTTPVAMNGNVTIGDAGADTLTVNAVSTFAASASFLVNVTLGDGAGDTITVNGTLTANAPATFEDTVTLNGATTANDDVTLTGTSVLTLPNGSAANPSLAIGDAGGLFRQAAGVLGLTIAGTERVRISASDLLVTGLPITLGNNQAYRMLDSGAVIRNLATLTASDTVTLGYSAAVQTDVDGAIVRIRAGTTTRIRVDSTGIGLFGATPIAQPTVSGSRGGNAALADLLTELDNLGLINDTTTA